MEESAVMGGGIGTLFSSFTPKLGFSLWGGAEILACFLGRSAAMGNALSIGLNAIFL